MAATSFAWYAHTFLHVSWVVFIIAAAQRDLKFVVRTQSGPECYGAGKEKEPREGLWCAISLSGSVANSQWERQAKSEIIFGTTSCRIVWAARCPAPPAPLPTPSRPDRAICRVPPAAGPRAPRRFAGRFSPPRPPPSRSPRRVRIRCGARGW